MTRGEVLGVLPQRVAAALQLCGVAGHARAPGSVPDLATDLVEGVGGPLDHVEAVDAERGVLGPLCDDVTDPLGAVDQFRGLPIAPLEVAVCGGVHDN